MTTTAPIALVVHGHFYQPPRENPWTDEVAREPSAAPFHDWNARIHAECYRANAYARIFGPDHRIHAIVNNYERISFNFGPTLARWIERHDARTEGRLRAGDAEQRHRLGHGGALAQVWSHPIAPLLSDRDRRTQIGWGLQDFRRRFGRDADGIWLPETAADAATLEALIDAGVRYTILAPEQIAAVRAPGHAWQKVDRDTVDTGRAYRWLHRDGSGRAITLAVFDGPLSRAVAFEDAARDAATLLARVKEAARRSRAERARLVLVASDGELYGHHKKFADLTLGYALWREAETSGVTVTNLGAFLAHEPPTWEAQLAPGPDNEGTAWSCPHGVGRWRRHCGCAMAPDRGWSQAWRGPLRAAFDLLRDAAGHFFDEAGGDLFADPWGTRNAYGEVLDAPVTQRLAFVRGRARTRGRAGDAAKTSRGLQLLELQRSLLAMYASCGWYFDDVAGLEAALVIRQAAYAIDLWRALGGKPPLAEFLDVLADARSNQAHLGTGADVYQRMTRERVTPATAVAHVAFGALAARDVADPHDAQVPGFDVDMKLPARRPARGRTLAGEAIARHVRTGGEARLIFTARHDRRDHFECRVGKERITLDDLDRVSAQPLRLAALAGLMHEKPALATCRTALAIVEALGPTGTAESTRVREIFTHLLLRFLEARADDAGDVETWALAAELMEHAGLPAKTPEGNAVENLVWEALSSFHGRKRPPRALRTLAERLGFQFDGEAAVPP